MPPVDPLASDPTARPSPVATPLASPLPGALGEALAERYRVERVLGAGGMATVYLAEDLRHRRRVAVKVLHPDLSAVLGPERFLQEIELTASLQHPHILPLFDSGRADGLLYYVMPYVGGETLRARLDRERQLPLDDALRIAREVADALAYAHGRGVIHRDVKPENVLLQDGHALVADFGIALAVSNAGGQRITQTGLSLGTPQYMSPEQATGDRVIDARADVYALGAVTYEMLAGEPPYTGATAQAVIARLLTTAPQRLTVLRPAVPAHVAEAVHRALERLPADRFATAREFAGALDDGRGRSGTAATAPSAATPAAARRALPWAVAAAATALAATAWARGAANRPAEADEPNGSTLRFPIALGDGEKFDALAFGIPLAFSPDDRRVAYASLQRDTFRLLVRALDELEARPVAAAEGLSLNRAVSLSPAFSPDGRWIALALADRIVRVPIEGGSPVPITALNGGGGVAGMTWLSTDTLLASVGGRLVAIPAQGGAWRPVSTPDSARDEIAQWGPTLLPGGARVAYVSVSRDGIPSHRIATVPLAGGRQTITGYRGVGVLGTVHQHLVFVTVGGGVSAVPVDALTERASTEPVPVLDGVLVRPGGAMKAALSARGSLVYQRGESAVQLTLVDAHGAGTPLASEGRVFVHPRLSPDGRRVAVEVRAARGTDVWLYTRADRTLTRLTTDGSTDGSNDLPEWSPDGRRVIYRAMGRGGTTLRWVRADGSGEGGVLVGPDGAPYDGVFTPDGRTLVYRTQDRRSIVAVPLDGTGAPAGPGRPVVSSAFLTAAPRVSPDGRWLAYISDETGKAEVYVRAFPGPGPRAQVSSGGGGEPQWSRDGGAVYYRNGRALLAARLTTTPSLAVAGRDTLFTGGYLGDVTHPNYDVAPDGRGFLMLQAAADESETLVVHGWAHELRARLGGRRGER